MYTAIALTEAALAYVDAAFALRFTSATLKAGVSSSTSSSLYLVTIDLDRLLLRCTTNTGSFLTLVLLELLTSTSACSICTVGISRRMGLNKFDKNNNVIYVRPS